MRKRLTQLTASAFASASASLNLSDEVWETCLFAKEDQRTCEAHLMASIDSCSKTLVFNHARIMFRECDTKQGVVTGWGL